MPSGPACTLGMQHEKPAGGSDHRVTQILLGGATDLVGSGLWDHISKAHALTGELAL